MTQQDRWPTRPSALSTQLDLAKAFSGEKRVAAATVSSWESLTTPKTPTAVRLNAYARFFATRRSLTPQPHLIPLADLEDDELERFHEIEAELSALLEDEAEDEESADKVEQDRRRQLLRFSEPDPIIIICSEAPMDSRGRWRPPTRATSHACTSTPTSTRCSRSSATSGRSTRHGARRCARVSHGLSAPGVFRARRRWARAA